MTTDQSVRDNRWLAAGGLILCAGLAACGGAGSAPIGQPGENAAASPQAIDVVRVVEQSLNIAANLCDRAVFLEKGTIRFEGPPKELLERGDIARSVFLGAENRKAG